MWSVDEALQLLAEAVSPLSSGMVPLSEAHGLVLAADVRAEGDHPPANVSAMDGYAARAGELSQPLPVAFEVPAGAAPGVLQPGTCCRIFTGAPLPEGADTVVPQEEAEVGTEGTVRLKPLEKGKHVRPRGEVFRQGDVLIPTGTVLTGAHLGLAAMGGCPQVQVVRSPRVAVLMTGSELVPVDEMPGPGQIRNSNGVMCAALAGAAGLMVTIDRIVPDTPEATREALREGIRAADLIVTCGGVSVGDYDLVPRAISALAGELVFHGVSMKPGKPVLLARIGRAWLLGLPGNPVSALACWALFGVPLARRLQGHPRPFEGRTGEVALAVPLENGRPRTLYQPAHLDEEGRAVPVNWRGSHDLRAVAGCPIMVRLEPFEQAGTGERVPFHTLELQ